MKKNNKKTPQTPFKNPIIGFIILSLAATFILNLILSGITPSAEKEIYYSEFLKMVEDNKIEEIKLSSEKIVIYPKKEKVMVSYQKT